MGTSLTGADSLATTAGDGEVDGDPTDWRTEYATKACCMGIQLVDWMRFLVCFAVLYGIVALYVFGGLSLNVVRIGGGRVVWVFGGGTSSVCVLTVVLAAPLHMCRPLPPTCDDRHLGSTTSSCMPLESVAWWPLLCWPSRWGRGRRVTRRR